MFIKNRFSFSLYIKLHNINYILNLVLLSLIYNNYLLVYRMKTDGTTSGVSGGLKNPYVLLERFDGYRQPSHNKLVVGFCILKNVYLILFHKKFTTWS